LIELSVGLSCDLPRTKLSKVFVMAEIKACYQGFCSAKIQVVAVTFALSHSKRGLVISSEQN